MAPKNQSFRRRPKLVIATASSLVAAIGIAAARLALPAPKIPTAEVKRGEFIDYLQLRGELKAHKSLTITAPFAAGDLQIIKLARNGGEVKKGEVVVQFDVTKLGQDLAQDRSVLRSAEAEIEQVRAEGRLKEEQDLTDLLKARYEVETAKLEAGKQEILSKIDGEEAQLKVADAEQKLRQTEAKLNSDRAAAAADLESKNQKRDKALFDVQQAEHKISVLTLRSPIDGVITLLTNWRAGGWFGGTAAPFKVGDRAWPGASIADLPELSSLRVDARIDETDRGRVQPGGAVSVRIDAVPDREFAGRVGRISPLASTDFSAGWPFPRNFDLEIELDETDPRLRQGMSATARLAVDRSPNAILVPPEASFQKAGQTVAFVLQGSKFQERAIEVGRRSEGQLLVARGLKAGERVALKDPTVTK